MIEDAKQNYTVKKTKADEALNVTEINAKANLETSQIKY